ncbi:MAG: carboxypeptidase regulatory-like domain-containing protein [Candidatus Eremiobacteraeota bacterium]|nr:carboxypeptidase regulatory-like domain-containing protein [Candidatus Eremiobacteraeota bacterium]
MKKASKAILLLSIILMVAVLFGCGGGGGGGGGGSVETPTYSPTPTGAGNVSGTIYDESGSPLEGATVSDETYEQESPTAKNSTTTDANGNFTLNNVPSGTRQLTAYKGEYSVTFEIYIMPDATVDAGDYYVMPFGTIDGYVKDEAGNPLFGAMVAVDTGPYPTPTLSPIPTPTLSPLPTPTQSPPSPTPTTSPVPTPTVTPGSSTVQGRAEEYLTLSPVEGVTVTIGGMSATTDSNGQYVINGAPSGFHLMYAEKSGYYSQSVSILIPENSTATYNFMMVPSSYGNRGKSSKMTYLAITDANGYFSLPFIPEGTYTVTGALYGYEEDSEEVSVVTGETSSVELILTGGIQPTPTVTPTTSPFPTVTPTYTPTPTPTPTETPEETGSLYIIAYGFSEDDEWVQVKSIRVYEYGYNQNHWFDSWVDTGETYVELECDYATLDRYYVVEVKWHNGATKIIDTIYFDTDWQTEYIYYF